MSGQRAAIPGGYVVVEQQRLEKLELLRNVVQSTAKTMLDVDNGGTWETFTCSEVEHLAAVFRAAGCEETALFIIGQHGLGDYDPEDAHHDVYEANHKERP